MGGYDLQTPSGDYLSVRANREGEVDNIAFVVPWSRVLDVKSDGEARRGMCLLYFQSGDPISLYNLDSGACRAAASHARVLCIGLCLLC
jgi:hypothetical protein